MTKYNHEIHNKQLNGDKALSFALNPSEKKLMEQMSSADEVEIEMYVRATFEYDTGI